MFKIIPAACRIGDDWGQGHWGASRGSRDHKGIDYLFEPGEPVLSPVRGRFTHYGTCYSDNPHYRYVQITTYENYDVRLFYVEHRDLISLGQEVQRFQIVGYAQDISAKYVVPLAREPMLNHVHLEVKDGADYIEPWTVVDLCV